MLLRKAIINGYVTPMQMHQGSIAIVSISPDSKRYEVEFVAPLPNNAFSPIVNRTGVRKAPAPMMNSATPYNTMGDTRADRLHLCAPTAPIQDPRESPSMNTETTMDRTGVITPNAAKAFLSQMTS
jgi:hypothetical protein